MKFIKTKNKNTFNEARYGNEEVDDEENHDGRRLHF